MSLKIGSSRKFICLSQFTLPFISPDPISERNTASFLESLRAPALDRQLELLALEHTSIVDPEEITIQDRLDHTGDGRNPVDLVAGLGHVAVDPVGDVQGPVQTEREEVVRRDGLGLASALEHEELGQDGDRLEPDGEGPEDLPRVVVVREQDGQDGGAAQEVLDPEGVEVAVVGRLVRVDHQVDDVPLCADEEDFEDEVVQTVCREEVCATRNCVLVVGLLGGERRRGKGNVPRYRVM